MPISSDFSGHEDKKPLAIMVLITILSNFRMLLFNYLSGQLTVCKCSDQGMSAAVFCNYNVKKGVIECDYKVDILLSDLSKILPNKKSNL